MQSYECISATSNVGHIHVVSGGAQLFQLLASEKVNPNEMDLGVTVFTGLGGGHVDDFARAAFDHDRLIFAQRRALSRLGQGSTRIGLLDLVLML